jgi:hypothetical protein
MNDWDRHIIGAASREDLLSIRDAANETARAVAELAGAYKQRCIDDEARWGEVRGDIGKLHGRINALPAIIDQKVSDGIAAHAEGCAENISPIVQGYQDRAAARRLAMHNARSLLALAVLLAVVLIGALLVIDQYHAAAIIGTVLGAATPFALLVLNRK